MGLLSKIKERLFAEKPGSAAFDLEVDLHSHLIPGIDDGCTTGEESLAIIKELAASGIRKIITTPHILQESYPNTPETILSKAEGMRELIRSKGLDIEFEAAAEYYLDDHFVETVKTKQPLLTFGSNMVLVETNYIQPDHRLKDTFFHMKLGGYKPVFAHPERYLYLNKPGYRQLHDLYDFEILFQCNLLSFTGYYGQQIKTLAEYMLKNRMIHMVGSDIHRMEHARIVNRFKQSKTFEAIMKLELMNNSL